MEEKICLFFKTRDDYYVIKDELEEKFQFAKENNMIIAVDVVIEGKLFDTILFRLLELLDFYQCGYINSYKILHHDQNYIDDVSTQNEVTINSPTTIFNYVPKDITLILNNQLTVLDKIEGTIIFESEKAHLVAKKLCNAKIVHPSGVFFPYSQENVNIDFFDDLCVSHIS